MSIQCSGTSVASAPITADSAAALASMFKALGDPVRLRLVSLIASHVGGEACVCDLSPTFDLSQPTISHHLKVLREAGLLTSERRGTWVYYRADYAVLKQLSTFLDVDVDPALQITGSDCAGAE